MATLAGLSACGGPQVRQIGTGYDAPAYAVQAASLAEVDAQARQLCPRGFVVLRAGQNATAPLADEATQAMVTAGQWLAGLPGNVAQATIQCRA